MKPRGERYLQDCLWKESLLAIKVSLGCQSVAELIVRLREHLPQNSAETRERNASIILSRFFPTSEIDQLPRRILRTYDDETLLAAVMRVLFLEAEPLVVASQAPPPAKLMGGARGDRFKVMSLFAGEHSAREYDAIVSSVVRDVLPDRLPEGNAYYDHYYRTYSFLKQTKREYFQQVFPFQPRCFEVSCNIAKRELATTRSSIHYVYEVLEQPHIFSRQGLVAARHRGRSLRRLRWPGSVRRRC